MLAALMVLASVHEKDYSIAYDDGEPGEYKERVRCEDRLLGAHSDVGGRFRPTPAFVQVQVCV